jgi:hypothetical protein
MTTAARGATRIAPLEPGRGDMAEFDAKVSHQNPARVILDGKEILVTSTDVVFVP